MLLVVIAGFLLALGLQLRARPLERDAGYYLGADGVVSLTSWKVIEPSAPRRPTQQARPAAAGAFSPAQPAPARRLPARPWGDPEPEPLRAALRFFHPPGATRQPSPPPAEAPAARIDIHAASPPAPEPIVIPADLLAEIEAVAPPAWAKPPPDEPVIPALDEFPLAFATFSDMPAHSLALH
jgi:hypothetical protein